MNPRDVFLNVSRLTGDREVRVFSAKGAAYAPPAAVVEPEPERLGEQLTRVEQHSVAARAALIEVSAALAGVSEAVEAVVNGQKETVASVDRVERTLSAPVEPVYDGSGKIIGAQRKKGGLK